MEAQAKGFLKSLLDTPGPTGYEEKVVEVWRDYVKQHIGSAEIDTHGSGYGIVNPDADRKVMVVGHADEVGLIVKYVDDSGFVYVGPAGGVDPAVLLSQRVQIITGEGLVPGVISKKAVHLMDKGKNEDSPKLYDLWIDIGAKDGEEARSLVRVGDPIVWGGGFEDLRNGLAVARNFDNRVGCYAVAEMLRRLNERKSELNVGVIGVASVWEEVGAGGIGPLAAKLTPDLGIAIDVTHDTNTPTVNKQRFGDTKCGRGPVLVRGVRTRKKVFDLLEDVAKSKQMDYQIETDHGRTGTDADTMYGRLTGIPISVISIPCRYMHTSTEIVSLDDVDRTVDLLVEFMLSLKADTAF